jgi:transposase InsO family protein
LGVSASTYYRRLKRESWARTDRPASTKTVGLYEATEEEKRKVREYALKHPEVRHRELAWQMVDEDVVYLSQSTIYRILREECLVSPWRRRRKRTRREEEKAGRPDERWATDLMYLRIGSRQYFLVNFIDEYSRYIVHYELLPNMEGGTVSLAAQRAIEKLLLERDGEIPPGGMPEIRTDNGSCYVSRDFRSVVDAHDMSQLKIKPHCPEENGIMERANRTLREALEGAELTDFYQAQDELERIVRWYNETRLHRALGYLRPIDYYRGTPSELHEARRRKLAAARHARKEANLALRQRTFALDSGEAVA